MIDPGTFILTVIWGVAIGCIYVLLATGLNLIFGVMKLVNFAHGELLVLGAYICHTVTTIFGLTLVAIGLTDISKDNGIVEFRSITTDTNSYRKLLFVENRIVGAILLGRTGDAGILSSLLRNKKDISLWEGEIARTPLDIKKLLIPTFSC